MSLSSPFIKRPVATTLLTIAIALAGALAYFFLPVSPLPQVDFPTISVSANLPGANPENMARDVATPLEKQFTRIAGVTEMTSSSNNGQSSVNLVFDLSRNIDAAARDVQAAINAARGNLPTNLPSNPNYRKTNPADAPIMILAVTSDLYEKRKMYDVASTILSQKIAQVEGVGQVNVGGGSLPAVRVEVNPTRLNNLGLGMDDVRTALAAANVNRPKGSIEDDQYHRTLFTTDQLHVADEYKPLIVAFRNGAPVRLSDVASVTDSVEDYRNEGIANGKSAILLVIFRQPGANIIATVDAVKALKPQLEAQIPAGMKLDVVMDRTLTIRASVHDVQTNLCISIVLVILVVFFFLRDWRATLIPSVAIPVSLVATFGVMYLCGYSVDNLSLMALTIATGFVVDDAIVVIENVSRHLEKGARPMEAALKGASEIGFTVLSMSTSLVAVFIPILLMGDIVGRLFREFAVVLSVAIGISMIVSLTTTPMLCARFLKSQHDRQHGRIYQASERLFKWVLSLYETSLSRVLKHPLITLIVLMGTVALTLYLYVVVPKGFFPQQDTGRLMGNIQADQNISFPAMQRLMRQCYDTIADDPDVTGVVTFLGGGGPGGGSVNSARMFITLRPLNQRSLSADLIIARLRPKLSSIAGAQVFLSPVQDIRIGGRMSSSQYQYTLTGDSISDLQTWLPRLVNALKTKPGILDVTTDQQTRGLRAFLEIDRDTASRLHVTASAIDNALYDAFGQRQVSTMYRQTNQYHVVMTAQQQFTENPDGFQHIYVKSTDGNLVPLSAVTRISTTPTPLQVNHQGLSPSGTLSFNLAPGVSIGQAVETIQKAQLDLGMPAGITGGFAGTAKAYQASLSSQPLLISAAIITVYIVLGMLYESLIHPITILSTIPSAGVGALLALLITGTELNVMAMIGILLLIGIVKKNAIMMIDFALQAERNDGKSPRDAIFQACLLRFRPIMMTTAAALLGGLPLALGLGNGGELRRPLGIAIVGGLLLSQMLTLYTTPVVYLYLDRLSLFFKRHRKPRPALPLTEPV